MRILVALALVLAPAMSSQAAPVRFGAEVPLTAVAGFGQPVTEKRGLSVATDGNSFFAVWSDARRGVVGARIASDGTLLDPLGIEIAEWGEPAVVWSGRAYVVVWTNAEGIHAVEVTTEGVVGQARLLGSERSGRLSVATNGSTLAVVGLRDDHQGMALLVDRELHTIATQTIRPQRNRNVLSVEVAGRGNEYGIAVISGFGGQSIHTMILSDSGVLSAPVLVPNSFSAQAASVSTHGQSYLVVWTNGGPSIRAQAISADNQPLGDQTIVVRHDAPQGTSQSSAGVPRMLWSGNEYLLAYGVYGELRLLRVAADGTPIGAPSAVFGRVRYFDEMALAVTGGGRGAAFWNETVDRVQVRDSDPYLANTLQVGVFDPVSVAAGAPLAATVSPARAAYEQVRPAADRVGSRFVVAWVERVIGHAEVRVAMPGRERIVVTPEEEPWWMDVVYDGDVIWVLWTIGTEVSEADPTGAGTLYARRYTAALEPLDAEPLMVPRPPDVERAVTAGGGGGAVLLLWRGWGEQRAIVGQVLRSGAGAVTSSAEIPLAYSGYYTTVHLPIALWNGSEFAAMWQVYDYGAGQSLHGARITADGMRASATRLLHEGGSNYAGASGEHGIVVAWQDPTGTWTARLRDDALSDVRNVDSLSRSDWLLHSMVALSDGSLDLYFDGSRPPFDVRRVLHERLSDTLEVDGDPQVIVEMRARVNDALHFAATANGDVSRVVYARSDAGYGGADRLFTRSTQVRRRPVR